MFGVVVVTEPHCRAVRRKDAKDKDKYLIATSEQPMCAYFMKSVMEPQVRS